MKLNKEIKKLYKELDEAWENSNNDHAIKIIEKLDVKVKEKNKSDKRNIKIIMWISIGIIMILISVYNLIK